MPRLVGCIDFGGTKIRAGVANEAGELIAPTVTRPTEPEKPAEAITQNIARTMQEAAKTAKVSLTGLWGVGIGSPGPLDLNRGIVVNPPNLQTLHGWPLRDKLREALGTAILLNNDANVFVLGEAIFGAGRGAEIVYGVTLGTGFGNGLVMNGRIYAGATGTATEMAYSKYLDGMIEDYVSGRAVSRFYKLRAGRDLSPREIAEAARSGETSAAAAWEEFGVHLGTALSWIINLVDPDVVLLGGSLATQMDLFRKGMEDALFPHISPLPRVHCRFVPAELGDKAPLLGAAALALGQASV